MKKALLAYQGWVQQIVDPGQDYEIYQGPDATIAWVNAPDTITLDWTLEWSPSQQQMIWVERDAPFTDNTVARKVAYGDVGAQLDMIYHELSETGSISTSGDWYQHITTVKSAIPRPPPPESPITMEEMLRRSLVEEPSVNKRNQPSTVDLPAWKRYPGWANYGQ